MKEDVLNILRLLSTNNYLSQRDLSNYLGLSLGKTNYLIKTLVSQNLINMKSFYKGQERLKKVKYLLTPKGVEERLALTYFFLKRKEIEYKSIKNEWNDLVILRGKQEKVLV
ncbi:MAG: MarR family EPS-associated transcriptional regulator [Candidatus Omnitrophica bacterium]|nr:MarR family EPS-associated transcriptional regulator [Candidatus Omnitrophota bacterium]